MILGFILAKRVSRSEIGFMLILNETYVHVNSLGQVEIIRFHTGNGGQTPCGNLVPKVTNIHLIRPLISRFFCGQNSHSFF